MGVFLIKFIGSHNVAEIINTWHYFWILCTHYDFAPRKYRGFVDSIKLLVQGGAGGMGVPKYGGLGGKGGDVVLETKEGQLLDSVEKSFKQKAVKAMSGSNAHSTRILGRPGQDKIIEVPPGVVVVNEHNQILGELNHPGMSVVVAKGGCGGCRETGYSGINGERQQITIDLKLIADIGLVGFPNAGKSTLLKAITGAKPKIASYPFTTIKPNVGSMIYDDLRAISLADLPGLIEGAHRNVGMGHRFLRHCERTKLLLLVVDIQGFQLNINSVYRSCLETVILLNKEIELYRESLLDKPAMLVVNKMDTEGAWDKFKEIEKALQHLENAVIEVPEEIRPKRAIEFDKIIPISAKTSPTDVVNLKYELRKFLDLHAAEDYAEMEENFVQSLTWKMKESGPTMI